MDLVVEAPRVAARERIEPPSPRGRMGKASGSYLLFAVFFGFLGSLPDFF